MHAPHRTRRSNLILAAWVLIAWLLHQDFWFWRTPFPLIFGFLPIGLAYHALYAAGASVLMLVLVKYAWPVELEQQAEQHASPTQVAPR